MTLTIAELAQALNGRLWGEGRLVVTGAAEPQAALTKAAAALEEYK